MFDKDLNKLFKEDLSQKQDSTAEDMTLKSLLDLTTQFSQATEIARSSIHHLKHNIKQTSTAISKVANEASAISWHLFSAKATIPAPQQIARNTPRL